MDAQRTIAIILVICLILIFAAFFLGIEMAHVQEHAFQTHHQKNR